MPDQLKLRGGTTTEHNSFTGVAREVTVDTTKKTLVVHDGSQAGGTPLMKESGATAASSVQIGTGGVERLKLTSSEVVFNETSTDTDFRIEGDNQTHMFYVDAGNNRVGIGQSTPTSIFHIKDFNPDVIVENTGTGTGQLRVGLFGNGAFIGTYSDDGGGSDLIRFGTHSGDERMRLHSGGNLQVGGTALVSTDPYLTLGQSTNSQGNVFHLINNGTADLKQAFIAANKTSRHVGIDVSADNFFIGRDASVADLTINSSGNVGIGTTSPTEKLHVNGTIKLANYLKAGGDLLICADVDSSFSGSAIRFLLDGAANSDEVARFDASGNLNFFKEASSNYPTQQIKWSNDSTTTNGFYIAQHSDRKGRIWHEQGLSIDFGTSNELRMTINHSGNVGIGVENHDPLTILHAQGSNAGGLLDVLTITNENGSSGTSVGMVFECGADEVARISAANTGSDIGPLMFSTASSQTANPTEKMRLNSSGDLLIGTTSAVTDTKFVVDGNMAQRHSGTGNNQVVKKFVVSRAYSMSTTSLAVLKLDNWGTSAFEITAFRRDTASPHGAEVTKLYVGVQGSGSNMTDTALVQETKVTKGSIHTATYSINDNGNFATIDITGDDNGGEAQTLIFYIIANGGGDGEVTVL